MTRDRSFNGVRANVQNADFDTKSTFGDGVERPNDRRIGDRDRRRDFGQNSTPLDNQSIGGVERRRSLYDNQKNRYGAQSARSAQQSPYRKDDSTKSAQFLKNCVTGAGSGVALTHPFAPPVAPFAAVAGCLIHNL